MDTFRTAYVYVNRIFAGTLKETDSGYSFAYDNYYLSADNPTAVSLTLPLTEKPYNSRILFPFFDGLIPEGWLLNIASRNWKTDINDRFGLLLVACRDCIGNVTISENII